MAGNERCCCRSEEHTQPRHFCRRDSNPRLRTTVAVRRFYRSNRHLHHRPAEACASAIVGARWGTGDIGPSDSNTASLLAEAKLRRAACKPSRGRIPVRVSKAGFEPAFSMVRSIRNLHHQRRFSRARRQTGLKTNFIRGAQNGAATANPLKVRSAIGIRLAPRSLRQAPRFWARASPARAPGSGSPVPACAGMFR